MADAQLPATEYIKQGIFILVILSLAVFGIKSCNKYQQKKAIIMELTSQTSESSSYEQFYSNDAKVTLLKTMYQMHLAAELGLTPVETLKEVMEESEALIETENKNKLPERKVLIRDSLLGNYENCKKLGIFSDQNNLLTLEKGELPTIQSGPSKDQEAVITMIIPTSVLGGVDKLIPNLVISPPTEDGKKSSTKQLNEFEIARAKKFAKSLEKAALIEKEAHKKILDYYERKSEETQPSEP